MIEYLIIYIDMDKEFKDYENLLKFINLNYKDFNILKEEYEKTKYYAKKYNGPEYIPFKFKNEYTSSLWLSDNNLIIELFINYYVNYNPHDIKNIKILKDIINDFYDNTYTKNKSIKIFKPNYNYSFPEGNIFEFKKVDFFKTLWHINILNKKDFENINMNKLNQDYLRKITNNNNIHLEKLSDETYLLSSLDDKGNIYFLEDKDIFILRKELLKEEKLPHNFGLRV